MTNALFNDNRLKLGVFGLNAVCGWYEPEFLMLGALVMKQAGLRRPYVPAHAGS